MFQVSIVALRYSVFALSRKYRGNRLVIHQKQIDPLMDLAAFYVASDNTVDRRERSFVDGNFVQKCRHLLPLATEVEFAY